MLSDLCDEGQILKVGVHPRGMEKCPHREHLLNLVSAQGIMDCVFALWTILALMFCALGYCILMSFSIWMIYILNTLLKVEFFAICFVYICNTTLFQNFLFNLIKWLTKPFLGRAAEAASLLHLFYPFPLPHALLLSFLLPTVSSNNPLMPRFCWNRRKINFPKTPPAQCHLYASLLLQLLPYKLVTAALL